MSIWVWLFLLEILALAAEEEEQQQAEEDCNRLRRIAAAQSRNDESDTFSFLNN